VNKKLKAKFPNKSQHSQVWTNWYRYGEHNFGKCDTLLSRSKDQ